MHYNKLDEMLDKVSTRKGERFHMRREKYVKKDIDEDDVLRNFKNPTPSVLNKSRLNKQLTSKLS